MKLEPKAKPVRIRIKSGGEEHFSLDSLKRNFSVQDLWEAVRGKSLSRWLKQQNEKELAEKVDTFCQIEKPSAEDYIKFTTLFFGIESIDDADSLIGFYQEKGLKKNIQYAFSYLLDYLSYENARIWYDTFKNLKSQEDWIAYFVLKLPELNLKEQVECNYFLYELYKKSGDAKKMIESASSFQQSVEMLSSQDNEAIQVFLNSTDYVILKLLFESPIIKLQKETNTWILSFENCKDGLSKKDKAECLFILSKLYGEIKNKKKAKEYLVESDKLGYKKSRLELMKSQSGFRYPALTDILQSYETEITLKDLPEILRKITQCDEYDYSEIYNVFYHCVSLFLEVNGEDPKFEEIDSVLDKRKNLCRRFPKYQPLIYLISGLAWEEKKGNKELFSRLGNIKFRSDYQTILDAKKYNNALTIIGERELKCDFMNDSPIEQMFFFMETCEESYSFDYLRSIQR